jgi:capsular exopolysaccharide synthesis family protein
MRRSWAISQRSKEAANQSESRDFRGGDETSQRDVFTAESSKEDSTSLPNEMLERDEVALPRRFVLPETFSVELQKLKEALLHQGHEEGPLNKSILFSSIQPKGGSTTIVSSFAVCLAAQNGLKTLLLDANLRGPRLHEVFDTGECMGLAEVLLKRKEPEQCIVDSPVPNLSILPAGRDISALQNILNSRTLGDLFQYLEGRFQVMLLDSSPILEYSDFKAFAPFIDGVVLIIEADKTHWQVIQKGQRSLEEAGTPFLGFVLNKKRKYIPQFLLSGFEV